MYCTLLNNSKPMTYNAVWNNKDDILSYHTVDVKYDPLD